MLCKMAPGETDVHLDLIAGVATAIRKCALAYRSICCRTHTAGDQLSERFIAIASHRMVNRHRESQREQKGSLQLHAATVSQDGVRRRVQLLLTAGSVTEATLSGLIW